MSYELNTEYSYEFTDEDFSELEDFDNSVDEYEYENDEEVFGGYGMHFDCYSTFDINDYEYQQGLYY